MLRHIVFAFLLVNVSAKLSFAQISSPREFAMGGTSIASADYLTAGLYNPALIAGDRKSDENDFGLYIPAFSLGVFDENKLRDSVSDFDEAFDIINEGLANGTTTLQDLIDLSNNLEQLSEKVFHLRTDAGLAIASLNPLLNLSLIIKSNLMISGFLDIDPEDKNRIISSLGDSSLPDLESFAAVLAVFKTELGLSLAKDFGKGKKLTIGVTPKIQQVELADVLISADNAANLEDQIRNQARFEDYNFGLDLGAIYKISDDTQIALVLDNVLQSDYKGLSGDYSYSLEPTFSIGLATELTEGITMAAELDLVDTEGFNEIDDDNFQFFRVGAEAATTWAQIRVGYSSDLEKNFGDVITAGIGFSPFGLMHFDVAGAVGENSYGASVGLYFTF